MMNGKVGNRSRPLPALPVLRVLFWCNLFDVSSSVFWLFFQANFILINHPHQPSLAKSEWWVCRKVVVKHSINPNANKTAFLPIVRGYAFSVGFHVRFDFSRHKSLNPTWIACDEGGIRRRVVRNSSRMENHTKCIFPHTLHFKSH